MIRTHYYPGSDPRSKWSGILDDIWGRLISVQRYLDLTDEGKPQDLVQKNFDFDNLSGSCGSNVFMVGFISWNIHKLDISFSSLTISKFHNLIKTFCSLSYPFKIEYFAYLNLLFGLFLISAPFLAHFFKREPFSSSCRNPFWNRNGSESLVQSTLALGSLSWIELWSSSDPNKC